MPYETSPLAVWLFTRACWVSGLLFFPTHYNFIEYTLFPGTLVLLLAAVAVVHRGQPFRAGPRPYRLDHVGHRRVARLL